MIWFLVGSISINTGFLGGHRYRYVESAYQTLDAFMKEQVKLRKADIRKELVENGGGDIERSDVFSRLVLANESEAEKLPLDEQELVRQSTLDRRNR